MIYGSVCSGVEAASVAWKELGWKPAWFCEFDKFPSAVLKYRFPSVPNLGDMNKIHRKEEYNDRTINLLVGGTPCQSFSVAGLRKGLDDARGNLALKFCQILADRKPTWFIWENVPGVLSSNSGRDFAAILSGFRQCGYGFAYRVLDAQYFGVPQRRRRVFVVGHLGDWRPATAVLFERESLYGNPAPSRKTKKDIAVYTATSFGKYDQGIGTLRAQGGDIGGGSESLIPVSINRMLSMGEYVDDDTASTIKARDFKDATDLICVHGTQDPIISNIAHCLGRNNGQENAIFSLQGSMIGRSHNNGPQGNGFNKDVSFTLTSTDQHAVATDMLVRRFTPIECERLQGFPDNWTQIPWRGKPAEECPDGPRYKTMGNSMAVVVMKWLGYRIQQVNEILPIL